MGGLLKTEEEVKEYLKNLGTEYRFSCFKEKNAEGCHLLADYLEAVKSDVEASAKILKTNCDDNNYQKSCHKFGSCSYLGKGTKADCQQALAYYKKGCDLGHKESCLHAGIMFTTKDTLCEGNNPPDLDIVEGLKLLEKSCSMGNAKGCHAASGFYIRGEQGIAKDMGRAAELSTTACGGGIIYACMNLYRMYKKGDGVPKDEKLAQHYKEKAREIRDDQKRKQGIGLQQGT